MRIKKVQLQSWLLSSLNSFKHRVYPEIADSCPSRHCSTLRPVGKTPIRRHWTGSDARRRRRSPGLTRSPYLTNPLKKQMKSQYIHIAPGTEDRHKSKKFKNGIIDHKEPRDFSPSICIIAIFLALLVSSLQNVALVT